MATALAAQVMKVTLVATLLLSSSGGMASDDRV
jgi:hypothetical protein